MNRKKVAAIILGSIKGFVVALFVGVPMLWISLPIMAFASGKFALMIQWSVMTVLMVLVLVVGWVATWAQAQLDTPTSDEVLEATLDAFSKTT